MTLSETLLAVLACPKCKNSLQYVPDAGAEGALHCAACKVRYRIEGGVPVLLVDEAEPL